MSRRTARRRRGFTLLEVLLVMAILIIMVSVVTIGYTAIKRNADSDGARMNINALEKACVAYQLDVGRLPTALNELVAAPQNVPAGKWRGPYIEQVPTDPWGGEYQYSTTNVNNLMKPVISSAGPDLQPQTQDDITNIVLQQ
ncbi:MAG TPA: type II secretion system protein GspG [Planctomycetaceae bacterium]|nr:type II secretion system protein GspG [Planctomycetaceae bacterium]